MLATRRLLTYTLALACLLLVARHPLGSVASAREDGTLTVTFAGNGADSGEMPALEVEADTSWQVPQCAFTKADAHPLCWQAGSDGLSVQLALDAEICGLQAGEVDLTPCVAGDILALTLVWEPDDEATEYVNEADVGVGANERDTGEEGTGGEAAEGAENPEASGGIPEGEAEDPATDDPALCAQEAGPADDAVDRIDDARQTRADARDEADGEATQASGDESEEAADAKGSAPDEGTAGTDAPAEQVPMRSATRSTARVTTGSAYGVITDEDDATYGAGTLVLMRSSTTLAEGAGQSVTDVCGKSWSGEVFRGLEASSARENPPWSGRSAEVVRVVVAPGQAVRPRRCNRWFAGMANLTELNTEGLDLSRATKAHELFSGCTRLEELDLSALDTTAASDLEGAFVGCTSLARVTLGKGFRFSGDGSTSCALPNASAEPPFGGRWVREDDPDDAWDAGALACAYDADPEAFAGTWVWEVAHFGLELDLAGGAVPEDARYPTMRDIREDFALPGTEGSDLPAPVRPGFAFAGWVDADGNATEQVAAGLRATYAATATWEVAQIRVRVSVSCTLEATTRGASVLALTCADPPIAENLGETCVSVAARLETDEDGLALTCVPTTAGQAGTEVALGACDATLARSMAPGEALELASLAGTLEDASPPGDRPIASILWTFEVAS